MAGADDDLLYEYAQSILEQRREVVEIGPACAGRAKTSRARMTSTTSTASCYPSTCAASVPRRVARDRPNSIDHDGAAVYTEHARAAGYTSSYNEGLWQSLGRLLVMVLTAAVVFVRGNQNASSSMYMLERALNTVRCRDAESNALREAMRMRSKRAKIGPRLQAPDFRIDRRFSQHTRMEVFIDGVITLTALGSRTRCSPPAGWTLGRRRRLRDRV